MSWVVVLSPIGCPYLLGKSIEWKLFGGAHAGDGLHLGPYLLGKSIEWKQETSYMLLLTLKVVPTC